MGARQSSQDIGKTYDPNLLLDWLIKHLKLRNDADLARKLEVSPSIISRLRNTRDHVGPSVLIRMHEIADTPVKELRAIMEIAATA